MKISAWVNGIYKDRDYLTRNRAFHFFIFNVSFILLSISSYFFLWFAKGQFLRLGFLMMTAASMLSLLFLLRKKFELAVRIILIASVCSITFGWFFPPPEINLDSVGKSQVLNIFIMIFLYFSDIKKTIFVSLYCLLLILIDEFYLKKGQDIVHSADRIGLFLMFAVISILAVKTLHGSVQEKNELIQEIHHRVRNNLQVISGLLEIHSGSDKGNLQIILSDFQDRILAISEVHNYLYKSDNYFEIDFAEVIEKITINLLSKLGKQTIQIENGTSQIFIRIETAIPCAIIFSELLSNSLKHAFPSEKGSIEISFKKEAGTYFLEVADNGSGIRDSKVWLKPNTAGFTLIQILTKQIRGKFRILTESGSKSILEFNS
ncbi:sensor histidine kinase [Leptospira adleri]|uniref:histidine kinase n=1 Tax=Leptospira adleri TaxID=2023186 RepID=A0A2M9YSG5_9LEPT|nr:sensor histidine kinase [Leptospira adleri]PJZ54478.1 histidine kinase [Leptospira adleri]PJZ61193.1 histidine kinase [Leptospira adleri]